MKRLILISLACLLLTGCKEKQSASSAALPQADYAPPLSHKWFYFTAGGISRIDLPQKAEISNLRPWTETLRVCDANSSKHKKGFLVVNKLVIIVVDSDAKKEPELIRDYSLFSDNTASNLVFYDDTAYFTLYRNSFFNNKATLDIKDDEQNKERPYLVRLSEENKMFFPAVTYGDLELAFGGEVTGSFFDGTEWYSSIKTNENNRTYFSYISWKTLVSAASLAPATKVGKIEITQSSEGEYRNVNSITEFSAAPERLKMLLATIPADFPFTVYCKTVSGSSARIYKAGIESNLSEARAVMSDGWICAVFSDGTTYFSGALDSKPLVNNGKTTAFRLPKLPESYIYSDFCITGSAMAVGWEERNFYKTGRSGFILIDLDKVF